MFGGVCFFFSPNSAFPPEHLCGRNKRICTNPFYMNQIFMLCPLEALSSSNLWNVISWPQHSGTSKSAALWAVLEAAENFYTFVSQAYENLVAQLWHSLLPSISPKCASGKGNALIVPRLWHSLMPCVTRNRQDDEPRSQHNLNKCHGKLQSHVPPRGPFYPLHTAQFSSAIPPPQGSQCCLQNTSRIWKTKSLWDEQAPHSLHLEIPPFPQEK